MSNTTRATCVRRFGTLLSLLLAAGLAGAADLAQRRHLLIVGSSTAYPIITVVAERFARHGDAPAPVVESTGTGGGIKLFCSGGGLAAPDITMASRRMKESERTDCARNGVVDVREIKIGYDGIVIAGHKDGPPLDLSKKDLYLALAREVPAPDAPEQLVANPYTHWHQLNPQLPDMPIRVLGPPPTSGTRDMLVERLLHEACAQVPAIKAVGETDPEAFRQHCQSLREDGLFIDAGENDARLVRKLINDPNALGILGYNFLDRNRDRLRAAKIEGVAAEYESIEAGGYPFTRPLYLYVKPRHRQLVQDLATFVDAVVSPEASGPEGYLIDQGLIPLPESEQRQ